MHFSTKKNIGQHILRHLNKVRRPATFALIPGDFAIGSCTIPRWNAGFSVFQMGIKTKALEQSLAVEQSLALTIHIKS